MNAHTIKLLSAASPLWGTAAVALDDHDAFHRRAVRRFVESYSNVAIGWELAGQFAMAKQPFPMAMLGRDSWVFKAYLYRLNPRKFYDPHIAEAAALAIDNAKMADTGNKLRSFLLVPDMNDGNPQLQGVIGRRALESIANNCSISMQTLHAFDALFYNVSDRRSEALYMSNVVYPNGRLVEWQDDYLKTAAIGDIMKRAGYNNGSAELVAHISGISDNNYMMKLAAQPDREAVLERQMIGNALVLAQASLLNQKSIGMSRSQRLLEASREGGQQAELRPIAGFGEMLLPELNEAIMRSNADRRRIYEEDAGLIDATPVVTVDV